MTFTRTNSHLPLWITCSTCSTFLYFSRVQFLLTINFIERYPTRHLWDSEGTGTKILVQISPDYWSVCRPIGGSILWKPRAETHFEFSTFRSQLWVFAFILISLSLDYNSDAESQESGMKSGNENSKLKKWKMRIGGYFRRPYNLVWIVNCKHRQCSLDHTELLARTPAGIRTKSHQTVHWK